MAICPGHCVFITRTPAVAVAGNSLTPNRYVQALGLNAPSELIGKKYGAEISKFKKYKWYEEVNNANSR